MPSIVETIKRNSSDLVIGLLGLPMALALQAILQGVMAEDLGPMALISGLLLLQFALAMLLAVHGLEHTITPIRVYLLVLLLGCLTADLIAFSGAFPGENKVNVLAIILKTSCPRQFAGYLMTPWMVFVALVAAIVKPTIDEEESRFFLLLVFAATVAVAVFAAFS